MAEIIKTSIDVDINTSGAAAELRKLQQQINAFNLTLNKNQQIQSKASKVWAQSLADAVNRTGMFRAEMVRMQTSANALDATLRKGQATLGQFFSAAFNKRSAIAAETFALAAERARTMQTQFIATGKAAKGMQDALAIRPLSAFSSELSIASQRTQILGSMFRQGTTQLINFGKNVQWAGRQLMVGFTVPLTIFGTTAGRVFRDLEMQAVAFKKVYGDIFTTPMELQDNLKAVEGLSREFTKYGIAAKDTMSLAAQAAAAGRRNGELTDAVRESTRLATLGQMDQNSALETTIALQSAFRLSGQQLSDTINYLNMVENQTVVSLQDIASAIPRVAPVIQGLGGDVKDLTVFLAAMQEGGVSAEQGANALKSGLGSLINPSKEATEQLGALGINIKGIVQQNQGDLMGIVTTFSRALATLGEFQQQQVLETLFGKYQYARLGALFENIIRDGSQAQQVIATMGYSTEQLAATAEKELKTVEQAFSIQLIAAIERLKLAIAPIGQLFTQMAIPIVNFLTRIVEWFNRLPEGVKNFTALATVITGLLIPAATMMFGLFANLIGTLAKMGQSITMLGVTLLKKGPLAAIKSLTESGKYLSLSEIDAANAARQLGSATSFANEALFKQVASANNAKLAIDSLTASYTRLIAEQMASKSTQGVLFATGAAASELSKNAPKGGRIIRRNQGGKIFRLGQGNMVPGSGNTDTVPALLTPGEFVVNKESAKNNMGLLSAINAQRYNKGGGVANKSKMFYGSEVELFDFIKANNLDFSGRPNSVEERTAFKQFKYLYELYSNNGKDEVKREELRKLVNEYKDKRNKIQTAKLQTIAVKLGLTTNKDKKEFFKDKDLGMINAAHTTPVKIAHVNRMGDIILAKTGMPIQELSNRVIGLSAELNNGMRGQGVPASRILKEIQGNGLKIFEYMDSQFIKYLDLNAIDDVKRKKMVAEYEKQLPKVYNRLVKQLSKLPEGALVADDATVSTTSFKSLFDNAMLAFDHAPGGSLKSFHSELLQLKNQRLPRVSDLIQFFKEDAYLKQFLASKGTDIDTVLNQNKSQKGKVLWRYLLEANGHDVANPEKREEFWKKILTKNGTVQQPIVSKPNVANPLNFTGTVIKKYIELRKTGGARLAVANTGGRVGKAIFERMKVGRPAIKNLSGLDPRSMRMIDEVAPFIGADAAIDYAKILQQGHIKVDIGEYFKKAKGLEDIVQDRYREWKSQNQWAVYNPKLEDVRQRAISKIRKQVTNQEFERISKGRPSLIDDYNKKIDEMLRYPGYYNKGGIAKFNSGNIVPGVGNTDTVPAMLTPGEFVVNKQSTKNNLALLHAINAQKLKVGGVAKDVSDYKAKNPGATTPEALQALGIQMGGAATAAPKGYVAARTTASLIGSMAPMFMGNMGTGASLIASIVGGSAASKATGIAMKLLSGRAINLADEFKTVAKIVTKLGPGLSGTLGVGGAAIALGIVLNDMAKKATQAGSDFVNAMYGSSNTMAQFATAMGRENIQQKLVTRRAEVAGGGEISQQSKQFSTQFLETAAGKGLLENASTVAKTRGVQGRNQAILNQLLRGVVTQSITAEEARAIAIDIGTKLNDQSIGINVGAKLNKLVGPNGENITDNLLNINAIITPKIDAQEAQKIVNEQWQNTGLLSKFAMIVTGRGTDDMLAKTIATQASQAAQITTEQLDLLKYELEQNNITYQEFILQKESLTKATVASTGEAIATIIREFDGDMVKATDAIKAFRAEVNKGFELKISGMDKADAARVRNFVNTFETGGVPAQTIQVGKTGSAYYAPKVNQNQADVLRQITDPSILLALSKIENINVNKKLEDMFAIDPTLVATMQDYVTAGGQVADFLSNTTDEMLNYQTELDRLAGVQEKFKTGVDITTLLLDPDKLSEFTKQATRAQDTLDALSLQKNITKDVAMNIITNYMGEDAVAKQLLEHYLSTGNKFEDLDLNAIITMGVANPEVANALSIIEMAKKDARVGMTAVAGAYNVLAKAGIKAGAGIQSGTGGGGGGEDPLQRIKDQIKDTNTLIGASQKLVAAGLRPEIAATLSAAEAKALLAAKNSDLIEKMNQEADKARVLANIYKDPRQMGIDLYNKQIEYIDKGIDAIERQISTIRRKNELDQRDINLRQRALEQLSKQEKNVNDQYDLRFESLDKVAKINDRIAQQTQDRISLASALTSGDFGAAAQAAAGMTANFASNQIEDARAALELQRKQEIEALTVSVNGQMLTRQQIQTEIDTIEERMYQRDQQIIGLQDQIYVKEQEKYAIQVQIDDLNAQITEETAKQTVEMAKQVGIAESLRAKLQAQYNIARAIALRKWDEKFGTGGEVKNFAYGGMVYRGSKEPPPALRMATGSIVPGIGLSDKVPALLTPGEFVVRKSVAQANMPLLNALNGNVFPSVGSFGMPEASVNAPNNVVSNISSPVYNYSVNVNVPNTTSSPNEIADVVINKIKMTQGREIRGNRY